MTPPPAAPAAPRSLRRRAAVLVLPVVVLLVGIGGTVGVSLGLDAAGSRRAQEASQALVDEQGRALGDAVKQYSTVLDALSQGIAEQAPTEDPEFDTMSAVADALPGLSSLSYTVPVAQDPAAVTAAQERFRAQFDAPITLHPAQTQVGEHRFIVAYRGIGTRETLRGVDAAAVGPVAVAATTARETGSLAISAPYVLLADRSLPVEEQQQSVVLTAPVLGGRGQVDQDVFRGWVAGAFRVSDVLTSSARSAGGVDGRLQLWDTTDRAAPVLMGQVHEQGRLSDHPAQSATVIAGTRRWTLSAVPTRAAEDRATGAGPFVALVVGGVASLLLAGLLFSVTAGRERAKRDVELATVELAEEVASRRRSEEALRTRESELDAYSTVVADRLRLPLARLSEMAGAARETDGWTSADWQTRLDRVDRRLDTARRLVDDLLLYARVSEMALTERTVDLLALGTLVADGQEALSAHLPDELQPRIEVQPLPEVVGEPWLLQQVLQRLVDNAVVHAPYGQPAVITLSADLTGSRFRGEVWRIEVRDRGLGVPAERRATVFEPFAGEDAEVERRTNHLSLALCRRIVLRLGGDIGLDDDPRGGSVFWFTLPVRTTAGRPAAQPPSARPVPALG
ncbi:ATP-binding protein [Kineococcus sp. LSe6-4]|uniref:Sensor-like histidine kinase SenX3 n=1 Tax=Kineococcus halophytocola TaxID=3234027 RepID=A0ABV4H1X2_9ACTN